MSTIGERLRRLGIEVPPPSTPVANFVPYVVAGSLVFISGQVPQGPKGFEYQGKVGKNFTVEEATRAARLCGLQLVAQLKAACGGNLERVRRAVSLNGFVNAVSEFRDHPSVVDGASELLVEIFGDAGKHARFAVGVGSLPFDVAVEVAGVFEID